MSERLHEWPLVALTTLAAGGAGLLAVSAAAGDARTGLAACLAIGLGFAVSTAHLGRPRRAPMALLRAGRSRLSDEIVFGGTTVAAGAAWLLAASTEVVAPALVLTVRALAGAAAVVLLVVIGLVYRLPAQRTWCGIATAAPAVAGVAFGAVVVRFASVAPPPWIASMAVWWIVIDVALTAARWRQLPMHLAAGAPAHQSLFARRHVLLAARLALFDGVPLLLAAWPAAGGAPLLPIAIMTAGLALDRLAFYGLAIRHSTRAELRRTERVIDRIAL